MAAPSVPVQIWCCQQLGLKNQVGLALLRPNTDGAHSTKLNGRVPQVTVPFKSTGKTTRSTHDRTTYNACVKLFRHTRNDCKHSTGGDRSHSRKAYVNGNWGKNIWEKFSKIRIDGELQTAGKTSDFPPRHTCTTELLFWYKKQKVTLHCKSMSQAHLCILYLWHFQTLAGHRNIVCTNRWPDTSTGSTKQTKCTGLNRNVALAPRKDWKRCKIENYNNRMPVDRFGLTPFTFWDHCRNLHWVRNTWIQRRTNTWSSEAL